MNEQEFWDQVFLAIIKNYTSRGSGMGVNDIASIAAIMADAAVQKRSERR